ncbi:hypothetical protein TCDM_14251 [Trypanosoma cruzi Dm28c]|uniref:Uncharacterized protein n=2 Tax=Trypanosoma cruzi TaxID=5693 RepID=V5BMB7_TRYCR|nr:hypothetical protein TCDM_14251 [Trypanosoma cruzi Dm28c]PBJ72551.1 hypothetical protein BCY84_15404 [Trypanosoma cruzi cruzi]PWU90873.1 hypothetical protein C4B63_47g171c [Trypanosoma cruzi]
MERVGGAMTSSSYDPASECFPTLTEAATAIMTPEELQNMRRNLTEEKIAHAKYLREHPEIDAIMRCAMRKLLMQRPEDPVGVLLEFFAHGNLQVELQSQGDKKGELERFLSMQKERGMMPVWPP